jgi:hypothetical protein
VLACVLALSGAAAARSAAQSESTPPPPSYRLQWAPPLLVNPIMVRVPAEGVATLRLDPTRDYIVRIGDVNRLYGVGIEGGHNVVIIGGHITIPWAGTDLPPYARRGLGLKGQTGTVHIEGLLIDNEGGDLSEGIQIAAPRAVVQIENVRITGIHARDEVGFTDNHPDLIQPWGGFKGLRIDHFTGGTDYQGISLFGEEPLGPVDIRSANIVGTYPSHFVFWAVDPSLPVQLTNVYAQQGGRHTFAEAAAPDPTLSCDGACLTFPGTAVTGTIRDGLPPGGDFVPEGVAGVGYVSPGYVPAVLRLARSKHR